MTAFRPIALLALSLSWLGCRRASEVDATIAGVGTSRSAPSGATVSNDAVSSLRPGPWGTLRARGLIVEPGPEHVKGLCDEPLIKTPVWRFSGYTRDRLRGLLSTAGLAREVVDALVAAARCGTTVEGCAVAPTLALLARLSPSARATIYGTLAENVEDSGLLMLFKRRDADEALWDGPGLTPRARAFLRDFSFRSGETRLFGDLPLLCDGLPEGPERSAALEALVRTRSETLELHVGPDDDLAGLTRWWARGGREAEVRPILESAARVPGGVWLDVSLLLPPLPRSQLLTFPDAKEPPHDCHFTALHFYRTVRDEGLTDVARVSRAFAEDYALLDAEPPRFGDLFLFSRPEGDKVRFIHSAIYIADDVLFSKNGRSSRVPFTLSRLDDLRATYFAATEIRVLRRRGERP